MAQEASTIPPAGIGSLSWKDIVKSAILAAIANLLLSLYAIINTGLWPTHADLIVMLKSTAAIILSYLIKNLGTNNAGEFLKKNKPVLSVPAEKLEKLQEQADKTTTS